ncbi:MAG TPA: HlyD family efflux transporter periplasmic adaptor subunit [Gemmatimonadaceae bacterium]
MRWSSNRVLRCSACTLLLAACSKADTPDAYGNFEANEVVVSSQAAGQLQSFTATEGATLVAGATVAVVDTTQLALERAQTVAQRGATEARAAAAGGQVGVYAAQLTVSRRNLERTRRLTDQKAATAQQLDQAERDYQTLVAQIAAARAQQASVVREVASSTAHIEQVRDRIAKSRVVNPTAGTVLATYVKAGEVVQPAQPLYRIAKLDTLTLRAYVTEQQLGSLKLGQRVQVHADRGDGTLATFPGVVAWVSSKAEFTPTPVQTRDERASLVYAVKISVPNTGAVLKIGMPGDLRLAPITKGT